MRLLLGRRGGWYRFLDPLAVLIVFAIFWFLLPRIYYYYSMRMAWHDTGAVYNSIRSVFDYGVFYYQDIGIDHNAHHFNAFWFLLAPLVYFLNPLGYVLLEAVPLIATVVAIFYYAKSKFENDALALMLGLAFAINPYTISINLAFHYEVWGIATLAIYAMFFSQKRYGLSMVFFVLCLSVKEDFWLYCILSQLVMFEAKLFKRHAVFIAAALAYKILILGFLWHSIYPDIQSALNGVWDFPGVTDERSLFTYLLVNITDTIQRITYSPTVDFMRSFGFILLLAPLRFVWVLAIIFLWANSTNPMQKSFSFYYSYPHLILGFVLLPFALEKAGNGSALASKLKGLILKFTNKTALVAKVDFRHVLIALVVATNVAQLYFIPKGLRSGFHVDKLIKKSNVERNFKVLDVIDRLLNSHDESVLVQFHLAAYVNYRKDLFCTYTKLKDFISGAISPAWVLVDLERNDINTTDISTLSFLNYVRNSSLYKSVYQSDGVFVFKRISL